MRASDFGHGGNTGDQERFATGQAFGNGDSESFSTGREKHEFRTAYEIDQFFVGNEFFDENRIGSGSRRRKGIVNYGIAAENDPFESKTRAGFFERFGKTAEIGHSVIRENVLPFDSESGFQKAGSRFYIVTFEKEFVGGNVEDSSFLQRNRIPFAEGSAAKIRNGQNRVRTEKRRPEKSREIKAPQCVPGFKKMFGR